MFGRYKNLREENEELHDEKMLILKREAGVIDAYHSAEKVAIAAKAELQELKDKYSELYEKYLNLLERHEKALEALHQPQTNLTPTVSTTENTGD